MRRARKGPRALGRLRKSLNATKRSLWKALLVAAHAKRSQSSGAAPEESKRHSLSGRLCWMRRAKRSQSSAAAPEREGERERGREGERGRGRRREGERERGREGERERDSHFGSSRERSKVRAPV